MGGGSIPVANYERLPYPLKTISGWKSGISGWTWVTRYFLMLAIFRFPVFFGYIRLTRKVGKLGSLFFQVLQVNPKNRVTRVLNLFSGTSGYRRMGWLGTVSKFFYKNLDSDCLSFSFILVILLMEIVRIQGYINQKKILQFQDFFF